MLFQLEWKGLLSAGIISYFQSYFMPVLNEFLFSAILSNIYNFRAFSFIAKGMSNTERRNEITHEH